VITADDWQPADGLILEPNALRAAKEQERCLALTAGPGAGKTEMLAQRADFLLKTGTCRYPKRILAISFKVDASRNLKERVERRCGKLLSSRFDSYTFHAFAKRIIDRFRVLLTGNDALDSDYTIGSKKVPRKQVAFDDLVPLAIQILEVSPIARNAVRQSYTDVFLDEFQDCTNSQYRLVKVAFQGTNIRLTAVGDTKQRIMGWAGALDGIFHKFAEDFTAIPLNMYRNFRSKPRLLRMQNEIIRVLDPTSVMPEEELTGDEGEIFAWRFENEQSEAEYLADLISEWVENESVPLSEIAVLVSKQLNLYAKQLMMALEEKKIPYRNEQEMQDITAEPLAKLIVDYLLCLYGQREPKAWIRLMEQLTPFSDDDVQSSIRADFQKFLKAQKEKILVDEFLGGPFSSWQDAVSSFLEEVGIENLIALSPDYESHTRLAEVINDTQTRIKELLKVEPDLREALCRFSDEQSIRILTIHKSKGLEFDSVIIMAIENEIFFGDQEANRSAFFVGVSRAKRRLVLTHAENRDRPTGYTGYWKISRSAQAEFLNYALLFTEP
jgi:superfamily I DNA/RNA helicase